MLRNVLASVLFCAAAAAAAEPLPELRIEPAAGGSIFYIHNTASEPLTAYLIELVNYPGSYYALLQDDLSTPIAPGAEKKMPVGNMIVGAAPDYVKMQAAIFADGSSAGIPEKAAQIVERRRAILATTRELIARLEKPADKADTVAALKQWADSLQPQGKASRSPAAANQAASQILIRDTAKQLDSGSLDSTLAVLRASEKRLAASKPAL